MDVLKWWNKLSPLPGGRKIFSKLIGWHVPYSGSIHAQVIELGPDRTVVELEDHRKVRNHLNSVHAVALINLAEMSSGLFTMANLGPRNRGILKGFRMDYHKKARGKLKAICEGEFPAVNSSFDHDVDVDIFNSAGEIVCKAKATWRVGPIEVKS